MMNLAKLKAVLILFVLLFLISCTNENQMIGRRSNITAEQHKIVICENDWLSEEVRSETKEQVMPAPKQSEPKTIVESCKDECLKSGLQECYYNNTVLRTCGNYDSDRCLEWGSVLNCGAYNVCENGSCVPQKLSKTTCEELVPGENSDTAKLNLIFGGVNFSENIVRDKASFFLFNTGPEQGTGLFTKYEPFKSLKDKFNYWVIADALTSTEFPYIRNALRGCGLDNWYGYIFVNNSEPPFLRSYSDFGPGTAMVLFVHGTSPFAVGNAVHETGHLIGNLQDEYRGGRQNEPADYYRSSVAINKNVFYDPVLAKDGFISIQECRDNAPWKNWEGEGCGDSNSIDCIDKYVFHKAYVLWDKPITDSSKKDLKWGVLPEEYCEYGNEENCVIELNGQSINPFNPGEGFVSVIKDGDVYRQEMFSHDILCKPEYDNELAPGMPGMGACLNEVDCFVGGLYNDYNVYRPTFKSVMASGPDFGPYNEYLIQQRITELSTN